MKKILAILSVFSFSIASVASVVSCGFDDQKVKTDNLSLDIFNQIKDEEVNLNLYINSTYRFIKKSKENQIIPDVPSKNTKIIEINNPEYNGQDDIDHFIVIEVPDNFNEQTYGLVTKNGVFDKNWNGKNGEWEQGYNPWEIEYKWNRSVLKWIEQENEDDIESNGNFGFVSNGKDKDNQEDFYEIAIDGIATWIQIKDYQLQMFIYEEINGLHKKEIESKSYLEKKMWYVEKMIDLIGNYDLILGNYIPLPIEDLDYSLNRISGSNISYKKILKNAKNFYEQIGNEAEKNTAIYLQKKGIIDDLDDISAKFINDLNWINLPNISDGLNSLEFGDKWHDENDTILNLYQINKISNLLDNKIAPWFLKIIKNYDDLEKKEDDKNGK